MSRGSQHLVRGANGHAKELGISPLYSGSRIEDEGIFLGIHREWIRLMTQGFEKEARNGYGS